MCVCLCVNSCASSPRERVGDPAEGALGHGDLERPTGRYCHWLRHLAAGTVPKLFIISVCVCNTLGSACPDPTQSPLIQLKAN